MSRKNLEEQFNENIIKLLNDFPNYSKGTYELNAEIKAYMYSNLDNPHVKSFIKRLAKRYLRLFTEEDLINAFKFPISHYRNIKIYSNLPLTINRNYDTYLFNLFNFESKNFYDMCKSLFELAGMHSEDLDDVSKIIERCIQFEEEHKEIIKASKSEYLDIEKEIINIEEVKKECNDLLLGKKNPFGDIVKAYAYCMQTNNEEYAAHSYINKKIGNIGEYYTFDFIKSFDNSIFVAKDLKDGFGYDMYYTDNGLETLVEVKTTTKPLDASGEKFKLSQNEFRVMKESLSDKSVQYLVVRIELNADYSLKQIIVLETSDGITFSSRNADGYSYRFSEFNDDGEAIFDRTIQKIKQK